ncbi:hypothetical protein AVKW3434_03015 [Acidovorax sp. SUPP3434]|uniref:rolling circle replication-associated protein n=1 Tax=Acidovorax sp. SUPP3434 TaxID=2920880 RepID=UPI0023DE59C3|nr:hypothetical protein [Acidovorax sp. SUPP3434]GKS98313.1 hypothetical protein AVKW3434_03015 [Acidovorax sp. SUPP3434]
MERIVGRDRLVSTTGGGFDLVCRPLGNGHSEYVIRPLVTWHVEGELSDQAYADYLAEREATAEERREANLERAALRAKQRVRHLCKAAGVDTLLTLTYRENMTDWATLKRHVKEFNRRMARVIPGWFYVAAFERQKRGAWHVHMAVHRIPRTIDHACGVKVKSYSVIRAVWHSVVGDLGGNVDLQAGIRMRAPSRIASYLSKYMVKAFAEGDAWSNRFSSSKNITVPKPVRLRFVGYSFADVVGLVFDELGDYACTQLTWKLTKRGVLPDEAGCWFILDTNIPSRSDRYVRDIEGSTDL